MSGLLTARDRLTGNLLLSLGWGCGGESGMGEGRKVVQKDESKECSSLR